MKPLQTLREGRWPQTKPGVEPFQHGWLAEGTARMLAKKLMLSNIRLVLELGAWLGKSTQHILRCAPQAHVISVDLWDEAMIRGWIRSRHPHLLPVVDAGVKDTYLVNLWAHQKRVTPLQMHSHDAIRLVASLGLSPDVVFLDTSHGYDETLAEVRLILDTFPETVLVGDDWEWQSSRSPKKAGNNWGFPVQRAIQAFLANHPEWAVETEGNGWALRRA